MCGELDDDVQVDNDIFQRFLQIARHHGATPGSDRAPPPDLDEVAGRSAYMENLFSAGLVRAVSDATGAIEGQRVEAIASQAIAFARLAGFLAGQLPPESDLFRAAVEALTDGYAMPSRTAEQLRRDQHHRHGHHGHDHSH
jgi:hypothetical protein